MEQVRILIVEDDRLMARITHDRLVEMGYRISGIVTSGEDAISSVKDDIPDLVLMDIRLNGEMDGIEAASQIHLNSNVPIIYLTAHADDGFLSRAKLTTPLGYILKPCEPATLKAAIEIALYRHSMEQQLEEERRRLQQALDEIRTLRGIVPICSYCKKIRDDEGYWSQVEKYVSDHTEAKFSHGICPACLQRELSAMKS